MTEITSGRDLFADHPNRDLQLILAMEVGMRGLPLPQRRWMGWAGVWLAFAFMLSGATPVRALKPGDRAPTFSAPALDGKGNLTLSEYRGKVVYLDFWASWCAPCLVSLPLLEELRREFSSQDFQVLAVNIDEDPDKARKFLDRVSVNYPSATDPAGRIPEVFEIQTMPTSFIIDREGIVRHVQAGFRKSELESLRSRILELVKAPQ